MKKIISLSFLIPVLAITLHAQTLEWARSMGGSDLELGLSIATDASGNVYVTGYFESTVDFDPGPDTLNLISNGNRDVFVQKLDASGNLLWAKSLGGTSGDDGTSIITDASGSIYVTGSFKNTVDFDPGPGTLNITANTSSDIFLLKLDTGGNLIWAKAMGGAGFDYGFSTTTDGSGNVYVTGQFESTVDFDPDTGTVNLTSNGSDDIFVQKLDASGNLLWARSMGGITNDYCYSITTDASDNVCITGVFAGTVDFDPGAGTLNLTAVGANDIFVQKLDTNGNLLWVKSMGGIGNDGGNSIVTDGSGNIYVTGQFESTVDFDPGPDTLNITANGIWYDIFVQKLDPSGNLLWVKAMGGNSYDFGNSISTDISGNVYVTGSFYNTVDFDPGPGTHTLISNGVNDIFVQKLDSNGNLVWVKSMGSSSFEYYVVCE